MAKKEKVEPGAEGFAVEVDEEIVVPREEDIVIPEKLSYIVVIIDELADLMLVAPADVEMAIARITQMARAAGIHCIVATQRPSVDVITGVIKANIPARIAFQVAAKVDSRTILDAMGADKLLGKGDMLYLPPGSAKLIRAQGALITDQEIQSIVDFIAKQGKPSYEVEIHQQLSKPASSFDDESGIDEDEEIIQQCIEVIRSEQKASVSLMQRRLRLGYTRAARIMDELENRGIVGPSKGAEPRDILIDLDGGGADGVKVGEFMRGVGGSYEETLKSRGVNLQTFLIVVGAVSLLFHLFYSFCFHLICTKVGQKPGILVWLPLLQVIPLHRAAGISPWLILLYFIPPIGLFVFVYWCVKVCRARGKSAWLVILVFIPLLNLLFIPYLAFSSANDEDEIAPLFVELG